MTLAPHTLKINRPDLEAQPSVRMALKYLAERGYDAARLKQEIERVRKTKDPKTHRWGRVEVPDVVRMVFEGHGDIAPFKAEEKKETRVQVRTGAEWLEVKKVAERVGESPFADRYKTAAEMASFASEEEVKEYKAWMNNNG